MSKIQICHHQWINAKSAKFSFAVEKSVVTQLFEAGDLMLFVWNFSTMVEFFPILSLWGRGFLIAFWFHKIILYDLIWMCFYMRGSLPWHVAKKWSTCISLLSERNCTIWVCTCMGLDGSRGVFCESWIKFQALCFAISSLSSSFPNQGIMGIKSNFGKISSHRAVPVLKEYLAKSLAALPRKVCVHGHLCLDVSRYDKSWDLVVIV